MPSNNPMSFRLSDEAEQILKDMERRLGLKRSGVIEVALRLLRDQNATGTRPEKSRKKSAVAS